METLEKGPKFDKIRTTSMTSYRCPHCHPSKTCYTLFQRFYCQHFRKYWPQYAFSSRHLPALFLCYNRNNWTRCKFCSKLTTKTRQLQQFWCYEQFFHVGVFCTSYVRPNLRPVSRGAYVTTCLNNPSPTPNKHAKIMWKKVWLFPAESYLL